MGFLTRLFGGKASSQRTTTVANPFRIDDPVIGFLNLLGERGAALMEPDRAALAPLFAASLVSTGATPACQVLFIYCAIGADGTIEGSASSLRQLIRQAGAYIAVVASENEADAYLQALQRRDDWKANITLVVERRGDRFARFFAALFRDMFAGTTMPMAWVKLAPQVPGRDQPDAPGSMMVAEAGHLTFKRSA